MTAVTAVSVGASVNLGSVYNKVSAQLMINSGTLSSINWKLEGSFNGTNWFDLETSSTIVNGSAIHSDGKLAQHIRASVQEITGSANISIIGGAY